MKLRLFTLMTGLALTLLLPTTHGQVPSTEPDIPRTLQLMAGDTLPAIRMKFEPALMIPSVVFPASAFFLGWHTYEVGGVRKITPRLIEPHLLATGNEQVLDFQRRFRQNRTFWHVATAGGLGLCTIGFVRGFVSLLENGSGGAAGTFLFLGTASVVGGQVARVLSFRSLRQAVNLYNHQYAGQKPRVSMRVGTPSMSPPGATLYLTF